MVASFLLPEKKFLTTLSHCLQQQSVVLSHGGRGGVVGSQLLLTDGESTLVERLRFNILALVPVECCQVVEAGGCGGVVGSQLLLTDGESTLVERLRFNILALVPVECCQVVEALGC